MEEELNPLYKKIAPIWRIILEMGSIIFLFYSNLLMGEFNNSGQGHIKGFLWAIQDIFTLPNFSIAIISSLIGYLAFGFLRNRL